MASLDDPAVRALLEPANHAVISTINPDGSIHSTVVWQEPGDGTLIVNGVVGRRWTENLRRDPRITAVVFADPYEYVEIRGTATGTMAGADREIDRLARKFTGSERFEGRGARSERITFEVRPTRVVHRRN
jgi:PPOX class probable F420-dependent enzyme